MSAEAKKKVDEQREKENRLASLYDEYFDRIAHYIYVRIGDRNEAEDLAGEVFVKALESLKSYKERGVPMQAWLFRIAHNVSVDRLRKRGRVTTVPIDGVTIADREEPVAMAEKSIEMGKVNEAMQKLTPEQREVVRLRFFGGLSSKEVGAILRKSDGAVREMQRAAVEKLRRLLTDEMYRLLTWDIEMKDKLDKILDECIDRINRGESIETCLADYPEYSKDWSPFSPAMLETKTAYSFAPSVRAKSFHRQRFNAALVALRERRERRQPLFHWILSWSKVWAPVAAAIVIALVGYFGLRPALMPPVMIAQPNPEGNFAFLVSDEVNAISDFQKLNLSISKVILYLGGDEEKKIEFEPGVQMVDLTDLQGNRAQEIWRGDVPEGEYSKVFLEVSQVSGILRDSGKEVEIKLPSGKLQISKPFKVESGEVTNFVYDLTVVKAGKSGQYILKPQIGQSGADQDFIKVKPEEQPEDNGKPKKTNEGKKSSGADQ